MEGSLTFSNDCISLVLVWGGRGQTVELGNLYTS